MSTEIQNNPTNSILNSILSNSSITTIDRIGMIVKKSNKDKLLYKINSELRLIDERINDKEDLVLHLHQIQKTEVVKDENGKKSITKLVDGNNDPIFKTYSNGEFKYRVENRFWKNPKGNEVSFDIKYKGKIISFDGMENKTFSCENDINVLRNEIQNIYNIIRQLDESENVTFFNQIDDDKS